MSPLFIQAVPASIADSLFSYQEIRNEKSGHLNLFHVNLDLKSYVLYLYFVSGKAYTREYNQIDRFCEVHND